MENTPEKSKIFLDTSVVLSGLNSPLGASAFILALFKIGRISVTVSPEVIEEANAVIVKKFPPLSMPFEDFLLHKPTITKKISFQDLQVAKEILTSEDTPILAGLLKSKAKMLITLDKRFLTAVQGKISVQVLTPGEFVERWRRKHK